MIKLEDIDYFLPEELIAVRPAEVRGQSRLLKILRGNHQIQDGIFPELVDLLQEGDCLVFNDTRVFKARLTGKLQTSSGKPEKRILLLLVERLDAYRWLAMVKNSKKIPEGSILDFGECRAGVLEKVEDMRVLSFEKELTYEQIDRIGQVPLPPYIVKKRKNMQMPEYLDSDFEWYQSILAEKQGSVAAPTASLHFTEEILSQIRRKGVRIAFVTLHVGPGTFKPIDTDSIDDFQIHREFAEIPAETVETLKETRRKGKRIVAVGTTVVRTLESMALNENSFEDWKPYSGFTRIFIKEGFRFQVVDALVTNFHMPKSTLLLLVYAFGGKDLMKEAYRYAIKEKYRFYSYGDAMVIV